MASRVPPTNPGLAMEFTTACLRNGCIQLHWQKNRKVNAMEAGSIVCISNILRWRYFVDKLNHSFFFSILEGPTNYFFYWFRLVHAISGTFFSEQHCYQQDSHIYQDIWIIIFFASFLFLEASYDFMPASGDVQGSSLGQWRYCYVQSRAKCGVSYCYVIDFLFCILTCA